MFGGALGRLREFGMGVVSATDYVGVLVKGSGVLAEQLLKILFLHL